MIALLNILLIFSLAWLAARQWQRSAAYWAYWPGLILKLVAGLAVGALYTYYYPGGDTFNLYNNSVKVAEAASADWSAYISQFFLLDTWLDFTNFDGDSRSMVFERWISILTIISGHSYYVVSLWCSFIAFLGLFFLVTRLSLCFNNTSRAAVISLLLWPSVVFWSSGLLKESLAMGSVGLMVGGLLSLIFGKRLSVVQFALMLLGILFLWRIKYYVAVPLIMASFAVLISSLLRGKSWWVFVGGGALVLFVAYWLSLSHPYLQAPRILQALVPPPPRLDHTPS